MRRPARHSQTALGRIYGFEVQGLGKGVLVNPSLENHPIFRAMIAVCAWHERLGRPQHVDLKLGAARNQLAGRMEAIWKACSHKLRELRTSGCHCVLNRCVCRRDNAWPMTWMMDEMDDERLALEGEPAIASRGSPGTPGATERRRGLTMCLWRQVWNMLGAGAASYTVHPQPRSSAFLPAFGSPS